MPWLLASPGHKHPCYWLCRMSKFLSNLRKDFNNLCHVNMEEWQKNVNIFLFPMKNLACKGLILLNNYTCCCKPWWMLLSEYIVRVYRKVYLSKTIHIMMMTFCWLLPHEKSTIWSNFNLYVVVIIFHCTVILPHQTLCAFFYTRDYCDFLWF